MIRILFIHNRDELKAYKTHKYRDDDFKYLAEGILYEPLKKPPFRDEDSIRILREAANVEFAEDDWFSIVFRKKKRSCITAVGEGIQHALVAVANSREGIYTSYEWLNASSWKVLADLSIDILLYFNVWKFDVTYPVFEVPDSVYGKVMIENHDYNGVRSCGILIDDDSGVDRLSENGELEVSNFFIKYCFDWSENIDLLLKKAEELVKRGKEWYKRAPIISNVEDFAATMYPDFASSFYERYVPSVGYRKRKYVVRENLKGLQVHNYLYHIPTETVEDYPMCLVMTKDTETGACTIKMEYGGRYPSFSDIATKDFVMPSDQGGTCVTLTVVIDASVFLLRENSFKNAVWAFKYYDNILELYDDLAVFEQFIKFLKQPYEEGLVTVVDWEGL